jgi:hypothetical protein
MSFGALIAYLAGIHLRLTIRIRRIIQIHVRVGRPNDRDDGNAPAEGQG